MNACGVAVAMLQGHSWAPTLSNVCGNPESPADGHSCQPVGGGLLSADAGGIGWRTRTGPRPGESVIWSSEVTNWIQDGPRATSQRQYPNQAADTLPCWVALMCEHRGWLIATAGRAVSPCHRDGRGGVPVLLSSRVG